MPDATVAQTLATANPNTLPNAIKAAKLSEVLQGAIPRLVTRTGLASSATQVHSQPGAILSVSIATGDALTIILDGSPASGEVLVAYDANGLATLTFNSAQTGYKVTQTVIPASYNAALTAASGTF